MNVRLARNEMFETLFFSTSFKKSYIIAEFIKN